MDSRSDLFVNMFHCPLCSKSVRTRDLLNRHLTMSHTTERPYKCPTCLATLRRSDTMRNHIKVIHEGVRAPAEKKWKCPTCSYKCGYRSEFERHVRKHSTERPFACNIPSCDFTTKRKSGLAQHVRRVHTFERPYECPSKGCSYKSATKGNLEHHLAVHTNERPFVCQFPEFKRAWKTKFRLNYHVNSVHSEDKPFKCSKCDFRTNYKFKLRQHEEKHKNIKRFRCQATNCSFSTTATHLLRSHFAGKHTKKTVKCRRPGCNYRCATIRLLNNHTQSVHVGRFFKCPVAQCIFSTRYARDVWKHVRSMHPDIRSELVSGQLKFQTAGPVDTLMCSFPTCNYQTEFQHRFNRHIKTHDKERRKYACKLCAQRLTTSSGLARHIQRHIGERPCKCSHCNYTAASDELLAGHARRIHDIHVKPSGRRQVGMTCRTCNEHYGCYHEFVLHSMTHLRAVVVLERLNLHVM